MEYIELSDLCTPHTKNIAVKDVANQKGKYPVFGAAGLVGFIDSYQMANEYVGIIKDGAGIGRTNTYPAKSSLIGTMQCLLPKDGVNVKYLMYLVRSLKLGSSYSGATIPHIYYKNYKNTKIPKRELKQQLEIADTLDNIEAGICVKQEQLKALDELIQSRFTEMFGKRFLSNLISLRNIADFTIGLTYKPENVSETGTIVLRSGNIQNNSLELKDDIVRVANIKIPDNKFVKENDILMCARNGSAKLVGKSCLISNLKEQMAFGAFMTVIRSRYPHFLQSFFTSSFFKAQLVNTATASVKQITSKMLGDYHVIQPTDEEENQFAEFVQQVEKAKEIVKIQIKDLQELLALKMDEYFR